MALQSQEMKLPLIKRIELRIHLYYCRCCSNFVKQNKVIDKSLEKYIENISQNPPFSASDDFKKKLKSNNLS